MDEMVYTMGGKHHQALKYLASKLAVFAKSFYAKVKAFI